MTEPQIFVRKLSKTYRVSERDAGLRASISSLWRRAYRNVEAVRDVSFTIEAGEIVGFLGPNGAGKTTTLKMLAGLLYPTAGEVRVAGFVPWQRKPDYLRRISMVLGNKSQMLWDIPPRDSFRVLGEIYRVPPSEFLAKPVRTLSLGERMKCELVAALLYRPAVLFLDEPTLGLDISMQRRLRRFIGEYNARTAATVILTSHYMADVEALCPRVIMINHGQLVYDGNLHALANRLAPYKLLRVTIDDDQVGGHDTPVFPPEVEIVGQEQATWTLSVRQAEAPAIAAHILNTLPVVDLAIEDPAIETIIETIYQGASLHLN
jgi:ABC-2 type transport system ATP-binding protein